MPKVSRRKIAAVFADELLAGRDITDQVAAYLVENRRVREADTIIRDVEAALADRGIMVADVTSAYELSEDSRRAIERFLQAETAASDVYLRTSIDTHIMGGVRIETPDERLDDTLRTRINQLKTSKI
jgi:F-type H+-transporting ATPase subunit delta